MINQGVLVGKVADILEDSVMVAVPNRAQTINDTSTVVRVALTKNMLDHFKAYSVEKNDVVGVRYTLTTDMFGNITLKADRITFMSSKGGEVRDEQVQESSETEA